MRTVAFSFLLVASLSTVAVAGPNGAVFCQDKNGNSEFRAFDIALKDNSQLMDLAGFFSVGGQKFSFVLEGAQTGHRHNGKVETVTDKAATVTYTNSAGKSPVLGLQDVEKNLGILKKVTYGNDSALTANTTRVGTVVVEIEGSVIKQLLFGDCRYEGALVSDWESIWKK